ncbi:Immunoglobulin I-set [Trinorchestia longiramus]|nr:Immunoglobulin I-set [Trinorchestia longiramus]
MGFLEVQVPPEIVDDESSGETEVLEGGNARLYCKASGVPTPTIYWRKEGASKRNQIQEKGENLTMTRVMRQDMGHYFCIAKNGVPPSVSKRIMLRVNFEPLVTLPINMFSFPEGDDVTIQCKVESSPQAVSTWRRVPGEQMIISSHKYNATESHQDYYVTMMHLTIRNFTKKDATNYLCAASNSLGSSDATITVNATPKPATLKPDPEPRIPKQMSSPKNEINKDEIRRKDVLVINGPIDLFLPTDASGRQILPVEGLNPGGLDDGGFQNSGRSPGLGEHYPGLEEPSNGYDVFNLFGSGGSTLLTESSNSKALKIIAIVLVFLETLFEFREN